MNETNFTKIHEENENRFNFKAWPKSANEEKRSPCINDVMNS